jgi:glutaredoxin 3
MRRVQIYTHHGCQDSCRAKHLLREYGIQFEEVDITHDPMRETEMIRMSEGRSTTPQIFVAGQPLGGYEELLTLAHDGLLAAFLGQSVQTL